MKTRFDAAKYLPVGWDWENLRYGLGLGHVASLSPLLVYLFRYLEAREKLYDKLQVDGKLVQVLDPSRGMEPFVRLILGLPLLGFGLFFGAMGYQVYRHCRYHTQGSMSVYLMRRLPDRWEYRRRCWTVPVLASLAELALLIVSVFLCWLLYRYATPAACLR